jgi:hypothetical protein
MDNPALTDDRLIAFEAERAASQPTVIRLWVRCVAPLIIAGCGVLCAFGAPHPIIFGWFAVAIALVHLQWRRRFARGLDVTALTQFDIPPPRGAAQSDARDRRKSVCSFIDFRTKG